MSRVLTRIVHLRRALPQAGAVVKCAGVPLQPRLQRLNVPLRGRLHALRAQSLLHPSWLPTIRCAPRLARACGCKEQGPGFAGCDAEQAPVARFHGWASPRCRVRRAIPENRARGHVGLIQRFLKVVKKTIEHPYGPSSQRDATSVSPIIFTASSLKFSPLFLA